MIAELATNPDRAAWPLERLRTFAGLMSERIRARSPALITLGGGRVAAAREWDHPAYDLDFLQVHSYPDVRYPNRDDSVFGRTAAEFRVEQAVADRRVSVASARCIRPDISRPRTRSRTT